MSIKLTLIFIVTLTTFFPYLASAQQLSKGNFALRMENGASDGVVIVLEQVDHEFYLVAGASDAIGASRWLNFDIINGKNVFYRVHQRDGQYVMTRTDHGYGVDEELYIDSDQLQLVHQKHLFPISFHRRWIQEKKEFYFSTGAYLKEKKSKSYFQILYFLYDLAVIKQTNHKHHFNQIAQSKQNNFHFCKLLEVNEETLPIRYVELKDLFKNYEAVLLKKIKPNNSRGLSDEEEIEEE